MIVGVIPPRGAMGPQKKIKIFSRGGVNIRKNTYKFFADLFLESSKNKFRAV